LRGIAVRGHSVCGRGFLVAVGAVVVADEHIGVDVAQADEVIALGVTGVDTGLVARDTGINDARVFVLALMLD
jgi:hypothetical protein